MRMSDEEAERVFVRLQKRAGSTHTMPMSQLKTHWCSTIYGVLRRIVEFTVISAVLSTTINRSILSLTYRI